jgi:hypothetical protein
MQLMAGETPPPQAHDIIDTFCLPNTLLSCSDQTAHQLATQSEMVFTNQPNIIEWVGNDQVQSAGSECSDDQV